MSPAPHILVVDDEPVIAGLLSEVLTAGGYRVTQSESVAAALVEARKHDDLALCITDFLLADRTGLDLARELRRTRPGLQVVVVSAYLEPEIEAAIRSESSVALIVRKPLDVFALREQIDALVGGSSASA